MWKPRSELAEQEVVARDLETAAQHLDRDQLVVRLVEIGHAGWLGL
jgi:hypothetical protein